MLALKLKSWKDWLAERCRHDVCYKHGTALQGEAELIEFFTETKPVKTKESMCMGRGKIKIIYFVCLSTHEFQLQAQQILFLSRLF